MAISEEKLSELEEALVSLGTDEEQVSSILRRFADVEPSELSAIDAELASLAGDLDVQSQVEWENDETEVEEIDPAEDFVLLVDEDDLEELESAGEEVPRVTVPPPLPGEASAQEGQAEGEGDDGFFKKLFGNRRSSNRP